jgi:hypothetical protein
MEKEPFGIKISNGQTYIRSNYESPSSSSSVKARILLSASRMLASFPPCFVAEVGPAPGASLQCSSEGLARLSHSDKMTSSLPQVELVRSGSQEATSWQDVLGARAAHSRHVWMTASAAFRPGGMTKRRILCRGSEAQRRIGRPAGHVSNHIQSLRQQRWTRRPCWMKGGARRGSRFGRGCGSQNIPWPRGWMLTGMSRLPSTADSCYARPNRHHPQLVHLGVAAKHRSARHVKQHAHVARPGDCVPSAARVRGLSEPPTWEQRWPDSWGMPQLSSGRPWARPRCCPHTERDVVPVRIPSAGFGTWHRWEPTSSPRRTRARAPFGTSPALCAQFAGACEPTRDPRDDARGSARQSSPVHIRFAASVARDTPLQSAPACNIFGSECMSACCSSSHAARPSNNGGCAASTATWPGTLATEPPTVSFRQKKT